MSSAEGSGLVGKRHKEQSEMAGIQSTPIVEIGAVAETEDSCHIVAVEPAGTPVEDRSGPLGTDT